AEVGAAIAQVLAAATYARDGSFAIASVLNEAIAAGDWTFYITAEDQLKKVTAADVQRVANAYFVEDKRTTGWFIPLPREDNSAAPEDEAARE
ncbi:MAG TPA: insulinase family protein, partial [Thermoanaerobaculia bacterium]